MSGPGYWLNPDNGKWVLLTRHELAMHDSALLNELGVAPSIIAAAQQITPYSREGEDQLRVLGIQAGLIRTRDHGDYISVQFDATETEELTKLRFVYEFFLTTHQWRPYVRVGNLRTNTEITYSWEEFINRVASALPINEDHG